MPLPGCKAHQGIQKLPMPLLPLTSQLCQESHGDTGCGIDSLLSVAPLAKIFLGTATTDKNMSYNLCQDSGKFAIATYCPNKALTKKNVRRLWKPSVLAED
ncbi:hypothetical protein llap_18086 [Limosa lapponica baueri]|uniref:Uncharacterized protein n=1 Tax=Limosa lapponica baueri TaxID=1758121 RepID=A0A2I0TCU5_LIMLA|nr:hypothetical protein llap_18086 [Limosa lapponica baueri]